MTSTVHQCAVAEFRHCLCHWLGQPTTRSLLSPLPPRIEVEEEAVQRK